ncbi:signal peptidase [Brevibacillus choshinensis]|uniref:Signal peptidase I n=1 Tax=Brevibacillus choshinensis TaxID=54911 RepID=A0ABR5MZC3_BRECH|nr:signal peptidase I [Brevibacillus choshinensis]KQL43466.1 signal peptidase [Brevibacillus choshinensis]
MKKWISRIVTWIFAAILIVMASAVVVSKASDGEPKFFGFQMKGVLSGSMEPTFMTGSVIVIKPGGDMNRFQKGDVITFRVADDKLVTHRVVDVLKNGQNVSYVTKGDNNQKADPEPVRAENIVGQYMGITVPNLSYLLDFVRSKTGAVILMITPGVFLLGYSILSIRKAINQLESKAAN